MIKTRYDFFKRTHREYVVVFIKGDRYIICEEDKRMLDTFDSKKIIATLNKLKINYIVIDDLEIVCKKSFEDNQYHIIMKKGYLLKLIAG